MALQDLGSGIKLTATHKADNWAVASAASPGVDCQGSHVALVIFNAGTVGTSGTVDLKVQDSADNSTFADVTGASFTQVTSSNDDQVYFGRVMLSSRARYIRLFLTVGTAACDVSTSVLRLPYDSGDEDTAAFKV